ncbi:hypothetical protein SULI_13020 [Saccharolobus solfataricus]|uniref:Uncharacterized protein n=2 Tax=Saccharolobus solfataricus TaxID=2287 RepID=A0A0E3MB71_SACSO|nr:hypothetical protein [Saccharolobus solfataricus]AKA74682.1 hypothetical protein SULB_2566 [Saccharolobus solfataricus]AKA77376.1 hypothetical protein SULC_2561 [Saccharolobus solfataricus]AKA80067.1 hypothetical protein SULA_2564 [Saccharolobus solfataricus]AZF69146.1 hypothetical protein SULG_13020 [Saccharolobus solfataricus]AZF71766.1 hypothetical protein SULH_13020 [Saccharolobus solfataricus]
MEEGTSILDSKQLRYLTTVFEKALEQVKYKLEEDEKFLSVEYELYPFDSDRIVITASNKKIREDMQKTEEGELRIPIVDTKTYSVSIENLRIDQNILKGDVGCFTWAGPLVSVRSPTDFYMADVKTVEKINERFEVHLSFESIDDTKKLVDAIFNVTKECITKATEQNS